MAACKSPYVVPSHSGHGLHSRELPGIPCPWEVQQWQVRYPRTSRDWQWRYPFHRIFRHDFMTPVMLDVVWTQRHVVLSQHWQGINSCWLVGVPMVLSRKCDKNAKLYSACFGEAVNIKRRGLSRFSVVELRHSHKRKLHETPKVPDSFWLHWIYRLPGPSALGKKKPN